MKDLRHVQLSMMEGDIIHSIRYETECCTPYRMLLNSGSGSDRLLNNRVATHASHDDPRLHAWLVHTLRSLDIFN
jgi:hypothetical protein